jgi:hypothetical protein
MRDYPILHLDTHVNEHERLSNITLRHKYKSKIIILNDRQCWQVVVVFEVHKINFEEYRWLYMDKRGCRWEHEYYKFGFMGFSTSTLCLYVH